jgi:hypothetical protein
MRISQGLAVLRDCNPSHVELGSFEPFASIVAIRSGTGIAQDGNYIVQFVTREGRSLSILVPQAQGKVLAELQQNIPYGPGAGRG